MRGCYVGSEGLLGLEESVAAATDKVVFLPMLQEIVEVATENGTQLAVRVITTLNVVLAKAFRAVEVLKKVIYV